MSQEVKTTLIGDAKPLLSAIDIADKRLDQFAAKFNDFGKTTNFGGKTQFNPIAPNANADFEKLAAQIRKTQAEQLASSRDYLQSEKLLNQAIAAEESAKRSVLQTQKEQLKVEQERLRLSQSQEKAAAPKPTNSSDPYQKLNSSTLAAQKTALGLTKTLDDLSNIDRGKGFAYLNKSANSLQKEAAAIGSRLNEINKEIAKKPNDLLLKTLQTDAKNALTDLNDIKRKTMEIGQIDARNSDAYLSRGGGARSLASNNLKLSSFQKTNLAYQINDVATMAAMGANPTQIVASQAGQIAQIFNPAQVTAFTAAYGGLVTVLGAGAAAIGLTYKITGDIRKEAERRLQVEESIVGAMNKQILGLRDAYAEYEKFKKSLITDKAFSDRITTAINENNTTAVKQERDRIDADNNSKIKEINRLQRDIESKEQTLKFTEGRKVNQGLLTELGIGKEYTASQKNQDVLGAKRSLEEAKKELAATEAALEKGKSDFVEANKALTTISENQDKAFAKRGEMFAKSQDNAIKFGENQQKKELESIKKTDEALQKSLLDFRESIAANSDNPFAKTLNEIATASDRLNEKFKNIPPQFAELKKIAVEAEKFKLGRDLSSLSYEYQSKALTSRQEARRLMSRPESDFEPFKRAMGIFERSVDKFANSIEMNKRIAEASFYANKFNPNNPKSFNDSRYSFAERDAFASTAGNRRNGESEEEYQRRRNEAAEEGVKVQDARNNIREFEIKSLGKLGNLGVQGRGAIADRVLGMIPNDDVLLNRLSSPFAINRENAQSLLSTRANALFAKQQADEAKFQDSLVKDQNAELNKQFAREQLGLLQSRKDLPEDIKNSQKLAILNSLGDDLDAGLKQEKFRASIDKSKIDEQKERDAAERQKKIDDLIDTFSGVISKKEGVKTTFDAKLIPPTKVVVNSGKGVNTDVQQSPSPADTEAYMNGESPFRFINGTNR